MMTEHHTKKETLLVICPGRGTYNATELGYLQRYHDDKKRTITEFDAYRRTQGQSTLTELDSAARFNLREHSRGDNASALIWACAYLDFLAIDRERFEIVAITGNSMGWYIALGCSGALTPNNALHLINRMGTLMHEQGCGGQLIYPLVDEFWQPIPDRTAQLAELTAEINAQPGCALYSSIHLGGLHIFAGNDAALNRLKNALPSEQERYPMQLFNHAAFHSPLQQHIAALGRCELSASLFCQPSFSLVDGRGSLWHPDACDLRALWHYTLDTQVVQPYNFSLAVQNAVKEFAPDRIALLGPGSTLGGATAQSLIAIGWNGWRQKQDFIDSQQHNPYLLSMGVEAQRQRLCG